MASTEGDSDSKNGDTAPGSLDNPLPDGTDPATRDGSKSVGGAKPTVSGKQTLPLSSEITTINLRLVLPGVSQPVEIVVSAGNLVPEDQNPTEGLLYHSLIHSVVIYMSDL